MAAVKSKTNKLKAAKQKQTNKYIIIGGIAAVAIVGALVVRFSGASTRPFTRTITQMSRGDQTLGPIQTFAVSGRTYGYIEKDGVVSIASKSEVAKSKLICAHVVNTSPVDVASIDLYKTVSGRTAVQRGSVRPNTNMSICINAGLAGDSKLEVKPSALYPPAAKTVGVDMFYGRP